MTFDPHPKEVVASAHGPVELLSTMGERAAAFERLGVDLLLVIPFTYEFSRLSSREFYERHVSGEVGVREVIVGHDHTFGRDREGGIEPLRAIGIEQGFAVNVLPPFLVDGERISSTRIRQRYGKATSPGRRDCSEVRTRSREPLSPGTAGDEASGTPRRISPSRRRGRCSRRMGCTWCRPSSRGTPTGA